MSYDQIKILRWFAVVTLLALTLQFIGGVTVVNYHPEQLDAALKGASAPIFTPQPSPSQYPLYSLILLVVFSAYLIFPVFDVARVMLFIPAEQVVLRYVLLMVNICIMVCSVVLLILLHSAAFFVLTGDVFSTLTILGFLSIYLMVFFASLDHLILGVWCVWSRRVPPYVAWGTLITAALGLLIHLGAALNTNLHPGRVVAGGAVIGIELGFWLVYLWSLVPAEDDEKTMTVSQSVV